ncbi:hypothetical protein [Nonomuraea sp. NPDC049480]|uniref:hypothetical protein n=1 Tax=Nonomuraea sp. NPDC049480 TaxID=3364353 RepID=UPI00379836EB
MTITPLSTQRTMARPSAFAGVALQVKHQRLSVCGRSAGMATTTMSDQERHGPYATIITPMLRPDGVCARPAEAASAVIAHEKHHLADLRDAGPIKTAERAPSCPL